MLTLLGLRRQAINRLTTNSWTLEGHVFLKSSMVRSRAIHCALRKS